MNRTPWILAPLLLAACQSDPMDPEVVGRKMIGLQEKFDVVDTNADGFLTRNELIAGYDELEVVNQTPETADAIIAFYDFNRDGRLSLREAQSGAVTGPEEAVRQFESGRLSP